MQEIKETINLRPSASLNYQRWRLLKDRLAGYCVIAGGFSVIVAIGLIFFYLLYVVLPLFTSATIEQKSSYSIAEAQYGKILFMALEEQNEVGVQFTDQGYVVFFSIADGSVLKVETIAIPEQATITSFGHGSPASGVVGFGFSNGQALIAKHNFKTEFKPDRIIIPQLQYPLGKTPINIDLEGSALKAIAVQVDQQNAKVIAKTGDQRIMIVRFEKQLSLLSDTAEWESSTLSFDMPEFNIDFILLDKEQNNLFLVNRNGQLSLYHLAGSQKPALWQHLQLIATDEKITALSFLNGDLSLLVGDSSGEISQWSIIRNKEKNYSELKKLRVFKVGDAPVTEIVMEQRRKGFIALDNVGQIALFNTTAERKIIHTAVVGHQPQALALSPRANGFVVLDKDNQSHFWAVHNQHPEISWKALWQRVWYESYEQPSFVWQSSAASNDFEPKFSLTPLVYGTLKAAFYAMLFAMPMAIMGAIYTAYFMSPVMRQFVKPSIEIMEALPTVILGFLAGLWLAPYIEANLAAVFMLIIMLPTGVILFAMSMQLLPQNRIGKIPEGWYAAVLIPVILFTAWLSFLLSEPLQQWFFDGDLRTWLDVQLGLGYDQRNSLVVGLAMGFAVIPTIFSITEDAIFSVPKHLTMGSLALGATSWQTLVRVVLLTASPGIFSAIMIGFGRAVGETMIVLMATGNTPIMDMSLFQGMRTLSANIAVEMPESEVNSSHYRILFLAALVLFVFTFIFNTLAEVIRQRLRYKYSSL